MPECSKCRKPIQTNSRLTEWDGLPYHKNCLKKKYREDNPQINEEEYESFSQKVEEADKFKHGGDCIIPVKTPTTKTQRKQQENASSPATNTA